MNVTILVQSCFKVAKCDRCNKDTNTRIQMFHADGFPMGDLVPMCPWCLGESEKRVDLY